MREWLKYAGGAASLVLLATAPAVGQRATAIRGGLGLEQAALRNPAESPYRLAGWGPTFAIGYDRRALSSAFDIAVRGGITSLHSDVSGGASRNGMASLDARYLRAIGHPDARTSWMVGAHVAAKVDVSNHRYNSTFGFTDQFGFVTSGFGALVRTTRKVGRGVISNDLAVPLASWVDFPYANIKVNGDALHLRFAGLRTLQAFDESISYWLSPSGRASVGWTYRVTYLRYHGDDVRRFARQSLMAVVRVRLNGTEP